MPALGLLTLRDALRAAVDAVHQCGVLHGDLAPRNVLRRYYGDGPGVGSVCVVDFSDSRIGTPSELADEKAALDEALDMEVVSFY